MMLRHSRLDACLIALALTGAAAEAGTLLPGESQSPIDIVTSEAIVARLDPLKFNYASNTTLTIVDTGAPGEEATVRADVSLPAPSGGACPYCGLNHGQVVAPDNTLTIGDTVYDLVQFHLHTGAEHLIDGVREAMEIHFVHRASDGTLAVVGQLIRIGAENIALAPYFDALALLGSGPVTIDNFDLAALIPDDLTSYRYPGSLTTPPFSEGVNWNVLSTVTEVSQAQFDAFAALFPDGNSREEQPINARVVYTDVVPAPVPLPASGLLIAAAFGGLALVRRRAA